MNKYYIIVKDNRNEFIFIGENKTRVKDINLAKHFSKITLDEFMIPIADNPNKFLEWCCGANNMYKEDKIAIPTNELEYVLNVRPSTVYYRNDV